MTARTAHDPAAVAPLRHSWCHCCLGGAQIAPEHGRQVAAEFTPVGDPIHIEELSPTSQMETR
jgi:hypothetical protein